MNMLEKPVYYQLSGKYELKELYKIPLYVVSSSVIFGWLFGAITANLIPHPFIIFASFFFYGIFVGMFFIIGCKKAMVRNIKIIYFSAFLSSIFSYVIGWFILIQSLKG